MSEKIEQKINFLIPTALFTTLVAFTNILPVRASTIQPEQTPQHQLNFLELSEPTTIENIINTKQVNLPASFNPLVNNYINYLTQQGFDTEDLKRGYDIVCIKNGNTVVFTNNKSPHFTRSFPFDLYGHAQQLASAIDALNKKGIESVPRRQGLSSVVIGRCG